MKKRTNNKGFTLVEIIIAVAILAIAVTPLIANFIQSSKINLSGRKTLNAMNLAQDVMEGLSGYTAEEVQEILDNYVADPTSAEPLAGTVLPATSQFDGVAKTSLDTEPVLVYSLSKVETVSSARNKYDVKLTLNPTGDEHKDFNEKELASISEINQYYDAVYTYDNDEATKAVEDLYKVSNFSVNVSALVGNVSRTITVKILNTGTETSPKYKVSVIRDYQVVGAIAQAAGLDGKVVSYTTDNISKMDEKNLPRGVYIYYQGMDGATFLSNPKLDNIVVESKTGKEITVYLVRTQVEGDTSNETYSLNYGCDVTIDSEDMMANKTEDVHIVSNLRYDLCAENMRYNFRTVDEDGNMIPESEIEYPLADDGVTVVKTSDYDKIRATYTYNGRVVDEALYQTNFSAGYAKKEKNTLYKVVIEVFDPETGKKVATYDGGLSN